MNSISRSSGRDLTIAAKRCGPAAAPANTSVAPSRDAPAVASTVTYVTSRAQLVNAATAIHRSLLADETLTPHTTAPVISGSGSGGGHSTIPTSTSSALPSHVALPTSTSILPHVAVSVYFKMDASTAAHVSHSAVSRSEIASAPAASPASSLFAGAGGTPSVAAVSPSSASSAPPAGRFVASNATGTASTTSAGTAAPPAGRVSVIALSDRTGHVWVIDAIACAAAETAARAHAQQKSTRGVPQFNIRRRDNPLPLPNKHNNNGNHNTVEDEEEADERRFLAKDRCAALSPLASILLDPRITKVMHAGSAGVMWLQSDFGLNIVNLYDTYIALDEAVLSSTGCYRWDEIRGATEAVFPDTGGGVLTPSDFGTATAAAEAAAATAAVFGSADRRGSPTSFDMLLPPSTSAASAPSAASAAAPATGLRVLASAAAASQHALGQRSQRRLQGLERLEYTDSLSVHYAQRATLARAQKQRLDGLLQLPSSSSKQQPEALLHGLSSSSSLLPCVSDAALREVSADAIRFLSVTSAVAILLSASTAPAIEPMTQPRGGDTGVTSTSSEPGGTTSSGPDGVRTAVSPLRDVISVTARPLPPEAILQIQAETRCLLPLADALWTWGVGGMCANDKYRGSDVDRGWSGARAEVGIPHSDMIASDNSGPTAPATATTASAAAAAAAVSIEADASSCAAMKRLISGIRPLLEDACRAHSIDAAVLAASDFAAINIILDTAAAAPGTAAGAAPGSAAAPGTAAGAAPGAALSTVAHPLLPLFDQMGISVLRSAILDMRNRSFRSPASSLVRSSLPSSNNLSQQTAVFAISQHNAMQRQATGMAVACVRRTLLRSHLQCLRVPPFDASHGGMLKVPLITPPWYMTCRVCGEGGHFTFECPRNSSK